MVAERRLEGTPVQRLQKGKGIDLRKFSNRKRRGRRKRNYRDMKVRVRAFKGVGGKITRLIEKSKCSQECPSYPAKNYELFFVNSFAKAKVPSEITLSHFVFSCKNCSKLKNRSRRGVEIDTHWEEAPSWNNKK